MYLVDTVAGTAAADFDIESAVTRAVISRVTGEVAATATAEATPGVSVAAGGNSGAGDTAGGTPEAGDFGNYAGSGKAADEGIAGSAGTADTAGSAGGEVVDINSAAVAAVGSAGDVGRVGCAGRSGFAGCFARTDDEDFVAAVVGAGKTVAGAVVDGDGGRKSFLLQMDEDALASEEQMGVEQSKMI